MKKSQNHRFSNQVTIDAAAVSMEATP